ncbi:choline dehydrogenase [Durotheca rogersii]|uniref:choline dehydrogenase n=1 Tax=Durotheca rogersii TaxID=419775 RepID=UPI00221F1B0C|nr:choline dehydrogenase [Durotheca rogersii]KAI5866110.1 choline dehydrogenase [Durotheca rogersii]
MKLAATVALASAAISIVGASKVDINITVPRLPRQNNYPPSGPQLTARPPPKKSYEYIIVGSGAGGSPLAARLALAGHSVLLVDAGSDRGRSREVEIPSLYLAAAERNDLSWSFFVRHFDNETQTRRDRKLTYRTPNGDLYSGVEPPKGSQVLGNLYPRVGGLGGCTEHLALLPILPANSDWDNIKKLTGDRKWDAKNMRGYFKKLEKNQYLTPKEDVTGAHGFKGWLATTIEPLEFFTRDSAMVSIFLSALSTVNKRADGLLSSARSTVGRAVEDVASKVLPPNSSVSVAESLRRVLAYDINNNSPNRDSATTVSRIPLSVSSPDGRRSSPRDWVYEIATAKNRDGSKKYRLDIALNTLVTKVKFDARSGRAKPKATGIEYLFGESLYRADPRSSTSGGKTGIPGSVTATREVIVAGGAFNTPQILKLSGIGPAAELARFGIPVVKDLPGVGGNLQDRYEVGVTAEAPRNFNLFDGCTFITTEDDPCYAAWRSTRPGQGQSLLARGPYATNGVAVGLWTRSSVAGPEHDLWAGGVPGLFQGYFPGMTQTVITPTQRNYFTWLVLKAHTRNNLGRVNLTSADPREPPRIAFHNFGEGGGPQAARDADRDVRAVVEGMRWALDVFDGAKGAQGLERVWPPRHVASDADLAQWVRDEAWGHHASCSCPIGADADPLAVLDGRLRVRGVDGLRVVDASAFPKIPGTFPALAIYMLAEKAADDILADAR